MFKIVGSIVVIFSCTMIGFEKSKEMTKHRKELEELQRIFTRIQIELEYMSTPFGELFLKIQNKTEGKFKRWMQDISKEINMRHKSTFEEIWITAIDIHFKDTFLTYSELEELKQIGKNISHKEALALFLAQIELFIQHTREEEKTKKKLYQSMGIMTGSFLVIVLI